MTGAATVSAVLLALVFVWAAITKAVRHPATVAAFAGMQVPAPDVLAVGVPVAEVAVAAALLVRPDVGGVVALVVLAVFTVVVARAVGRGAVAPCGCFGGGVAAPVSAADIVRNGLLAALAAIATGTSTLRRPSGAALAVMLVAGAAGLVAQRLTRRLIGAGWRGA